MTAAVSHQDFTDGIISKWRCRSTKPLATVVIGGLVSATLLTLIVAYIISII
jgi:multidrug efflux pump subunit AcrB